MTAAQPTDPTQQRRLATDRLAWADSPDEESDQIWIAKLDHASRAVVYSERFAMLRHFDSLRWQIPGLVFAVGGALGFAPKMSNGLPHFLVTGLYGLFAVFGAYLMYRIRENLRANNKVLRRFGISFGDYWVPPPPRIKSASFWMHFLLGVVGVASLVVSVVSAFA